MRVGDRAVFCRPRYSADPEAPAYVECAAIVTQCDDSDVVNLAYFEPDGRAKSAESVKVVEPSACSTGTCYVPA